MVKRLGMLAGLLCLLVGPQLASCAASPPPKELQPAIRAYNSRDYKGAVELLSRLSGANANNEYTHYYRAMSYQGLHRLAEAKAEYMWDYDHAKNPTLRYQAWQGLQGLARVGSQASVVSSGSAASGAASESLQGDAAKAAAEMHINPAGNGAPAAACQNKFKFEYEWKAGCPRHQ